MADYDPRDNSARSYDVAVQAMRIKTLEARLAEKDRELRQARTSYLVLAKSHDTAVAAAQSYLESLQFLAVEFEVDLEDFLFDDGETDLWDPIGEVAGNA
jgi:hypothetical protein